MYTVMKRNIYIYIMLFSIAFEYNHPITKLSTCVKMNRTDRNKKTC